MFAFREATCIGSHSPAVDVHGQYPGDWIVLDIGDAIDDGRGPVDCYWLRVTDDCRQWAPLDVVDRLNAYVILPVWHNKDYIRLV